MFENGRWVVLPYSVAKEIPGLRLIPPGVNEDRDRRPWWLWVRFRNLSYLKYNLLSTMAACPYPHSLPVGSASTQVSP